MSGRAGTRVLAALEEAALASWRRKGSGLLTVLVAGVVLAFPALSWLSLSWVSELASELAAAERVRVFLAPDAGPADVDGVTERLDVVAGITSVELVTPGQARQRFLRIYPELEAIASDLSPDELRFPASVEFGLDAAPSRIEALAAEIADLPGVEDVRHDADWMRRLSAASRRLDVARALVFALALAVTACGVGGAVAIGALSRHRELAIMRLVGAPAAHVRAPFWIEGGVHGALGGALSAALVSALSQVLAPVAHAVVPTARAGVPWPVLIVMVAAPGLAGLLGAAIATENVLRRHARLEQ